ncbi:hypothetical protein O181_086302 [Austropuccinia psidii MF-1]|uniref:Uncharacterized protein n=1 Tax=Austropuccinia psidii MF-1 TaxID=1389203 RepID=A0A9Q3FZJ1_9BASI|nr:hypothetical protein [Austropuccinia psidii MF-1]
MGRPKLTLYSLVIQLPDPLVKHYEPAIRWVCLLRSPVTKCTTCFSAWVICGFHPPCTFNNALTKALPGNRRSSHPRRPCEDSFVVNNDESIHEPKWTSGPQTGQQEQFQTISPVPSSIDLSTPPLMVTSLLDRSEVIIQPMKDGNGERTFELGPIVTMSCHPWDSNAVQTLRQPTPGPSGTQWSEDLFRKLSQHDEPPIPGPSPSSKPPEDILTREPEPEVAPTQSMEELFACPAAPRLIIITDDTPIGSPPPIPPSPTPPPSTPTLDLPPIAAKNPNTSSPQHQAPLITTVMLTRNSPTCNKH